VSFGKVARQSTTYTDYNYVFSADLTVDGNVPLDDASWFCAETAPNNSAGSAWWIATLGTTKHYVIVNVTLVNRRGPNGKYICAWYLIFLRQCIMQILI